MKISPNAMNPWVDLHVHTTKSDGSYRPKDILDLALGEELGLISITDHDTLEGAKEFAKELTRLSSKTIKYLSGIEIGATYEGGALHILGYGINIEDPILNRKLNSLREGRILRNQEIVRKLNHLGVEISDEDVRAQSGDNESQGRPHIAKALVQNMIVSDTAEAFDRFLGRTGKAYVKRDQCTAEEAITLIREAGGLAFLAHPKTLNLDETSFRQFLKQLIGFGLQGIEVYTPQHTLNQVNFYKKISEDSQLLISAGSDFHGTVKPQVSLGKCYGAEKIGKKMISQDLFDLAI